MSNDAPATSFTVGRIEPLPEREIPRSLTAALIAKIIVWTFAISVGLCFVAVGVQLVRTTGDLKPAMDPVFDLFKTVSAVLSGPLGFVLGYYFRERSE
jgi:hypothetical protein